MIRFPSAGSDEIRINKTRFREDRFTLFTLYYSVRVSNSASDRDPSQWRILEDEILFDKLKQTVKRTIQSRLRGARYRLINWERPCTRLSVHRRTKMGVSGDREIIGTREFNWVTKKPFSPFF